MSLYLSHHGIEGQKWGVRNGPPYPLDRKAIDIYDKASGHEPRVTKDIQDAAKGTSAEVYGLENRQKTIQSISRKNKLGKEIKDALRYTYISKDDDFVKNYKSIKRYLEDKGYSESRCKNYFEDYKKGLVKHKSVQCNYKTDDGYEFEIQFHTPSSQDIKTRKIPIYEESRRSGISEARKERLIRKMEELAELIPEPKDISKIKSH